MLKPFHAPDAMVGLVEEENEQQHDEIPAWDGEPAGVPTFGTHLNDIQKQKLQLASESKPLTVFITPFSLYQFNVMPFGLSDAPATFQHLMNRLLQGM